VPARILIRFDAPIRSPEILRTDRARHVSSQLTLSRRPRLIARRSFSRFGALIDGRDRVSPWTPPSGAFTPDPLEREASLMVTCTVAVLFAPNRSVAVRVAV
jgi:hypothetical protein